MSGRIAIKKFKILDSQAHCAKCIISKCSVLKNKHQLHRAMDAIFKSFFLSNVFHTKHFRETCLLSGAEECNIWLPGKVKYLERSPRESNRILRTPHMGKPDQLNQKIPHVVFSLRSPEGGSTVCF